MTGVQTCALPISYLKRLTAEIASEDGVLDVLYDGDEIAALAGWWGKTKREQRLLYGDEPYVMAADNLQKPGIMARIISPEVFVKAIRLKEAAGCGPSCILPIRLQDPLIPENDGLWFWHLGRNGSWKTGRFSAAAFFDNRRNDSLAFRI